VERIKVKTKENRERPRLIVVVPCYNEEAVLPITSKLFFDELNAMIADGKIAEDSRILFVNDGSKDQTWPIITGLSEQDTHFAGISQSRNRGHQNAVLAGLKEAKDRCDITISIDCDGQDDVHAMEEMVDAYRGGADIVYGVRDNRDSDSWFKRTTAQGFYKFLNKMGAEVVYNHADYRLVSARVLDAFADFKEVNLFLRGMFPLVGFKSACVYYTRNARMAGESHYPLKKMIGLAADGITSLSIKPIQIITNVGIGVSLIGFVGVLWALIEALLGHTVGGWASLTCIVCFLGGIQLLSLGVIGEYVGKTYLETKHRPRYIISDRTDSWQSEKHA
jgi:glycosyltransferase involved in cell wall biosynthesis